MAQSPIAHYFHDKLFCILFTIRLISQHIPIRSALFDFELRRIMFNVCGLLLTCYEGIMIDVSPTYFAIHPPPRYRQRTKPELFSYFFLNIYRVAVFNQLRVVISYYKWSRGTLILSLSPVDT